MHGKNQNRTKAVTLKPKKWNLVESIKTNYTGAPGGIRTPGLLVRSQTLYPAGLLVQKQQPLRQNFNIRVYLKSIIN